MRNCHRHLCIGATLCFSAAQSSAFEMKDALLFSWDPVTIKPQMAVTQTFNDNIFYRESGRQTGDLVTTLSPGVAILIGKRVDDYLTLRYTLRDYIYVDRTDLNTMEHSLELESKIDGNRLTLHGTDRLQFLSSPTGTDIKALDVQAGDAPVFIQEANIKRMSLYDNYTLTYKTGERSQIYVSGLLSMTDYEQDVRLLDFTTFAGTGGFGWIASQKSLLFGEAYYGATTTAANLPAPDYPGVTFMGGALGIRGRFTTKLGGVVRAGYETRKFDDGQSIPGSPVASVGITYDFSSKTSSSLNFVRRQDLSVYSGQQAYTANVVSLQASQKIGTSGKWRASAGSTLGMYDYDQSGLNRKISYEVLTANFALAYQPMLWLTAALSYDLSSVIGGEGGITKYDVNRISLHVGVGY